MNNIRFTVESGAETWDYDMPTPTREVTSYLVKFKTETVKSFAYRSEAESLAKKLNNALNKILNETN